MFKPVMKQRHLDAIVRMAAEAGRDPQEVYQELLDQATSNDAAPTPAPPMPAAPPPAASPQTAVPPRTAAAPTAPVLDETIAGRKARGESGKLPDPEQVLRDAEDDDEPPLKGDKPDPLRVWAKSSGDDGAAAKEAKEVNARAKLRAKYAAPNRPQK